MEIKDDDGTGCTIAILGMVFGLMFVLAVRCNNQITPTKTIETKEKVVPEYRLTTDGKTIDTIWIYKTK